MTSVSYSNLINDFSPKLSIPTFSGSESVLECAYAYADCGWWLVPISQGSKNPGSILGEGWPQKSSNTKSQLDIWFLGRSDRGIALHTGRSGALVVDVDKPEVVLQGMKKVLMESGAPFQASRVDTRGRGHYAFALPFGDHYTNSTGALGSTWGEIRTGNSVIIAEPSLHEKAEIGGCYKWITSGEIPILPREISAKLRRKESLDADGASVACLDGAELEAFVASMSGTLACELLQIRVDQALPHFRRGSRHNALTQFLLSGFLDARANLYPAIEMVNAGLKVFMRFKPREEWTSPTEFWDLVEWTASAAQQMSDDRVARTRENGLALVQPGVRAWLKTVSNV